MRRDPQLKLKNSASEVADGIDIKTHGGYICVAPSVIDGKPYTWIDPFAPVAAAPEWLIAAILNADKSKKPVPFAGPIANGTRNKSLHSFACGLRGRNTPEIQAWDMLVLRNIECAPPCDEQELKRIFNSAWNYPPGFPLTDLGNAERLTAYHSEDWRYLKEIGWLEFDGVRWRDDRRGKIQRTCADVARGILREALNAADEMRPAIVKWALKSESRDRLSAIESLSRPMLADALEHYDAHPLLLAVRNGVLDLEKGFREATRADRLRLMADVVFEAEATAPLWAKFLQEIFDQDAEMIAFIQRAIGYTLTGSNEEQVMFLLYGTGKNGKSTLANVMKRIMGDYAKAVSPETFMTRDRGGIPNDIARLRGVRFAPTAEVEDGQKLAESLVKQLTGGDALTARFLHQEFFDFVPVLKIWLLANHRPTIVGTDHAIWRRILLLPFTVTISAEKCDPKLEQKLLAESSGILNWMLVGCHEWQQRGLAPPAKVIEATDLYRTESDRVGVFLRECTEPHENWITRKSELYKEYSDWSKEGGYHAMAKQRFYGKLADDHKMHTVSRNGYEVYAGLRIKPKEM